MFNYQHLFSPALRVLLVCIICVQIAFCKSPSVRGSGISTDIRIVGGQRALKHEFPSIVTIKGESCAGNIIHPKWVLTAARCFNDKDVAVPSSTVVIGGVHNINSQSEVSHQVRQAVRILVHPEYTPDPFKNDLALIEVEEVFATNNAVKPVKLMPKNKQIEESSKGVIAGWGDVDTQEGTPDTLLKAKVPFVEETNCTKIYASTVNILPSMFCAGKDGVGACYGDVGGPLYCHVNGEGNTRFLCGVVAGGSPDCGIKDLPGIYMRITSYVDWINDTIKNV